jgi:D-amino-acid dehydrogenase
LPSADVAVVGGGIIGTTAALELQRRGHAVTIVERDEIGAGTAGGSAGYLAYDDILPIPSPAVVASLPRMLFDRRGPLVVQPAYLPHLAGWGLRFLAAARPSAVRQGIAALAPLNRLAREAHERLAARTDATRYLVTESVFHVCRSAATLDATARLIPMLEREGFQAQVIDRSALLAAEPVLGENVAGAVAFPNSHRCTNPAAYGAALARHFTSEGGSVVRGDAVAIQPFGAGWSVRTARDEVSAAHVVVAAGAWSGALLRTLGYRVPLESARGYHLMLRDPGLKPSRTLLFEEDHFCATPMEEGLRLAGTVEFAGLGAPPNFYRSEILYDVAREYLPALHRDPSSHWMGSRPSLPDSLPVIDALEKHPGIVAAFGHERRGLMQSAITARCVADLVERKTPQVDLTPFRIDRF